MPITLSTQFALRSSSSTFDMAFGSPNGAGALLTATVGSAANATASTITDSAGNLWLRAALSSLNQAMASIWYAENVVASSNTITVTNSSPTNSIEVVVSEWSGTSTANTLIAVSANTENLQSTHTAGSLSPAHSTALFLVTYAFLTSFDVVTPPTGYTIQASTFLRSVSYYKLTTSTTTENPEAVSSGAETTANVLAAFSGVGGFVAGTGMKRRSALTLLKVG